jgi:ankyrin repeat domain-containing protein 50
MHTLETLPRRIEGVYDRTWQRIIQSEPHHASLAQAALVWVLNAKQSLTIGILRHALATSPDTHRFEPSRLMPEAALMTVCRGLITVDKESRLVRLVRALLSTSSSPSGIDPTSDYTAREPLQKLFSESFPHPHTLLGSVCLARLEDCGFQNKSYSRETQLKRALVADPLLGYAYAAWAFHAQQSQNLIVRLSGFIMGCSSFPAYIDDGYGLHHSFEILGPLHLVAFYNLPISFARTQDAHTMNLQTRNCRATPLHLACRLGHHEVAQSLLCLPELFVNGRDLYEETPLMLAIRGGHALTVKVLLTHPEINVNLVDNSKKTALIRASQLGDDIIVKLLLGHPGVEINARARHGTTALVFACKHGHISVVVLLLKHPNIDVNATNNAHESTIKMAAERGYDAIVCILLEVPGIDTSFRSTFDGHTATSSAVAGGHHAVAQLLRDYEKRNTVSSPQDSS